MERVRGALRGSPAEAERPAVEKLTSSSSSSSPLLPVDEDCTHAQQHARSLSASCKQSRERKTEANRGRVAIDRVAAALRRALRRADVIGRIPHAVGWRMPKRTHERERRRRKTGATRTEAQLAAVEAAVGQLLADFAHVGRTVHARIAAAGEHGLVPAPHAHTVSSQAVH